MFDLKKMSVSELEQLQTLVSEELSSRKVDRFEVDITLSKKARYPCSYEQIKYARHLAEKNGSVIEANDSRMQKSEKEQMSQVIDALKNGKKIRIC